MLGRSSGLGSTLYFYHPHANDLTDEAGPDAPAAYFHWRRAANAVKLLDLENGVTPWVPHAGSATCSWPSIATTLSCSTTASTRASSPLGRTRRAWSTAASSRRKRAWSVSWPAIWTTSADSTASRTWPTP